LALSVIALAVGSCQLGALIWQASPFAHFAPEALKIAGAAPQNREVASAAFKRLDLD